MATQWQTYPIEFRGGLISNLSPLQQGINAVGSATVLQNFEPNKNGGYSKLLGFEKYSTTTVPGTGPILALKVISSGLVVAARKVDSAAISAVSGLTSGDDNKTAYYYSTGTTWTFMAKSVSTNGGKAKHTEFNLNGDDKVIFVDGTSYPAIYNTSGNSTTFLTSSNSSDISGAEHVAMFKKHAFYAKGNNLYFSIPSNVSNFGTGSGTINVGHDITGLTVFRDQLIIFTTDTIQKITGSSVSDWALAPITNKTGCINGDTIQEVGGDIIYLAPDGIRLLSATDRIGDFALDVASDSIHKDADSFLGTSNEFSSMLIRNKSQYRIFAYVSSERNSVAKGLIATKFIAQGSAGINWASTKGIKAYIADSRYAGDQETSVFVNDDGYVYRMETGSNFDSSNIEAIYESPFMPIQDPQIRKTFYKMTLYVTPTGSTSVDLNMRYDFNSDNTIQPPTQSISSTGTSVFSYGASDAIYNSSGGATYGGELDKIYNTNLIGSGKTVALRIADNSTNPTFTLDTAVLEYRQNDRQ